MKALSYAICTLGMVLHCGQAGAQPATSPVTLSMPEQPLRDALNGLARQTGLQVIYTAEEVTANLLAPKIEGAYTPEAALNLLLKGSGLQYQFINPRTVAVSQVASESSGGTARSGTGHIDPGSGPGAAGTGPKFTLVQADSAARATAAGGEAARATDARDRTSEDAGNEQTIVVTGSHIRGAQSSASPMLIFDREDILKSGFSSTQ
jgi:hypothetical protein